MVRDLTKRVAFATHAPNIPTGFGRVCHEVSNFLGQYYDMYVIGWQFQGNPMRTPTYMLCPTTPGGNYNEFGQATFPMAIPEIRPNVLIGLADYFVWSTPGHGYDKCWLPRWLAEWVPKYCGMPAPKWVWYFPVDSAPLNGAFKDLIDMCEFPITMSKFGHDVCEETGRPTDTIPHGVHPDKFKPMPNEEEKKNAKKYLGMKLGINQPPINVDLSDKFVFFWGGRNQIRKFPSILLEACGKFLQRTKAQDVYFIIHSTIFPGEVGYTLPFYLERYNLDRKVMAFTNAGSVYLPSDEFLWEIMRACDCYIDTAGGEGFGFFRIESAACGMSRIMPQWTCSPELMGEKPFIHIEDTYSDRRKDGNLGLKQTDSGFLVPTIEHWSHGYAADFAIIDVDYFVDAMVKCYENREKNHRMGMNGRQYVVDNYRWEKVLPMWKDLMDKVFGEIDFLRKQDEIRKAELEQSKQQPQSLIDNIVKEQVK